MKILVVILLSCLAYSIQAQEGFNKIYHIGAGGYIFGNVLNSNDTLYVIGNGFSLENPTVTSLFFHKIDTFGNVLSSNVYSDLDSTGYKYSFCSRPNALIKLSDNSGFFFVGNVLENNNSLFFKIDNDGEIIFKKEVELANSSLVQLKSIIEIEDGFLMIGNYQAGIAAIKMDESGNIIWESYFTSGSDRLLLFGSVYQKNDNEYIISGATTSPGNVQTQFIKNTGRIFAIDSLGNKKWEWESEQTLDQLGVGTLHLTDNGDWIFNTAKATYNSTFNDIDKEPSIVIRDTATFEILDERIVYTPYPGTFSFFSNLISLNDGDYLAIGTMNGQLPIEPNYVPNALMGVMYKINSDLDSIWSRRDTAAWSFIGGSRNYPLNAVELESGSIVVCGYHQDPETLLQSGWLYKVDKNGCMDTLNCVLPVSIEEVPLPESQISVYPNPTSQKLQVKLLNQDTKLFDVEIYNFAGQKLKAIKAYHSLEWIDVQDLNTGTYGLRLIDKKKIYTTKFVKTE
ncbi:MAG: hypothetical protein ACI9LN_002850 [Saprospiraceae bacterium]|jgi:hypothetical protein